MVREGCARAHLLEGVAWRAAWRLAAWRVAASRVAAWHLAMKKRAGFEAIDGIVVHGQRGGDWERGTSDCAGRRGAALIVRRPPVRRGATGCYVPATGQAAQTRLAAAPDRRAWRA